MWHRALQAIGALWVLQGAPELPAPRGYVNDFAGVISADDHDRIERIVQDVRAQSGGEIVIITLKDLGGRDIADIARQFGREWKVGKKGQPGDRARNTGVIILVVPKESSADGRGHVRIETGSGAEGFITDGDAGQIRDAAIPYFKQRDYGGGIALMTAQVAQRFAGEFGFALDSSLVPGSAFPSLPPAPPGYEYEPRIPGNNLLVALFVAFFIFIVILRIVGAVGSGCGCGCLPLMMGGGRSWMSSGGGWSSGGGGGGFGGFGGGGGFSGGGASGSW